MKLHTKIVIGLVAGAAAGAGARAVAPDAQWVRWLGDYVAGPVGQVFLRLLLMTVIPLVFASITLGVAGIGDVGKLGRIGGKTLAYFLVSTALSAVIGLTLVNLADPGAGVDAATREQLFATYRGQAEGMQAGGAAGFGIHTFVNIVPRNPVQAAASMDMLGVIFFSLVFGAALTMIPRERAAPILGVVEALGDVVLTIIDLAMKLAPYGVFGLIFVVTSRFGWHLLHSLGLYVAVVVVGLLLHATVASPRWSACSAA